MERWTPTAALIGLALVLLTAPGVQPTLLVDDGTLGTSGSCDAPTGPEQGCLAWVDRLEVPKDRDTFDAGHEVLASPDGQRLYVLGDATIDGERQALVHVLDAATGQPETTLRAPGSQPGSIALSPDGHHLYVAASDGAGTHLSVHAPDGTQLSSPDMQGTVSNGHLSTLAVVEDGLVCGAGSTDADQTEGDLLAACFDTQAGELAWTMTHDHGSTGGGDIGLDLVADASADRVYVSGAGGITPSSTTGLVIAFETNTGEIAWTDEGPQPSITANLVLDPAGDAVYGTGFSMGQGTHFDATTFAIDPTTGERVWTSTFDDAIDIGWEIDVAPDGSAVYVTGISQLGPSGDRILALGYDASTGEQSWSYLRDSGWNGAAWESGRDILAGPDGEQVYVAGILPSSAATGQWDYVALGLEAASGERVWYNTYDGPGHDFDAVRDAAIAPDGSTLYVTGQSFGQQGLVDRPDPNDPLAGRDLGASQHNDMATVAFDLTPAVVEDPVDEVRELAP